MLENFNTFPVEASATNSKSVPAGDVSSDVLVLNDTLHFVDVVPVTCSISVASPSSRVLTNILFDNLFNPFISNPTLKNGN